MSNVLNLRTSPGSELPLAPLTITSSARTRSVEAVLVFLCFRMDIWTLPMQCASCGWLAAFKESSAKKNCQKGTPCGRGGGPFLWIFAFFWRWQTKRKIRTYKQKLQLVTSSPFLQSCSWRLCQVTAAATKDAAVPVAVPSVGIPRVVKQFNVEGAGLPGSRVAQNQPRFTTISLVTRKWIENGIGFAAKIQFWTLIQIHHHHYL